MITIYCALYPEAQELIAFYQLKKEPQQRHFQVFSNDKQGIRLVITGVGAVAAAAAAAELSTCYPPEACDFLLNFGSCAGGEETEIGKLYLCNRITEEGTGRTFYPDVLYRHPFAEHALTSAVRIRREGELAQTAGLWDMEAAAVYQAGSYYYAPHQMIFLKMVSDHGMTEEREPEFAQQLHAMLAAQTPVLTTYLSRLAEQSAKMGRKAQESCKQRERLHMLAEELGRQMHCSVTMQAELEQLLFYLELTGDDVEKRIRTYHSEGRLPAKDKREGKLLLETIKKSIFWQKGS